MILLETIREIRASERKIQSKKITDIYATSFDYDKNADITKEFFATVQKQTDMCNKATIYCCRNNKNTK